MKRFAFTIFVLIFVGISLAFPVLFGSWWGFDLKLLIIPLIQIIMFGMGTTLSLKDFSRVLSMPKPVLIGLVLQFTVMPLTGYLIAVTFGFEAVVAAGIVLVGSCPGGVASNLMAYLAGGNVALSVTMTSVSTLISPLMTPFLMKVLAGRMVPIDFLGMMFSIINMIIVPILAGLAAHQIFYGKQNVFNTVRPLLFISISSFVVAAGAILLNLQNQPLLETIRGGFAIGLILIALVALGKLVMNVVMNKSEQWIDRILPLISMGGICFIIAIITSRSADKLLTVGLALIAASIIHNSVGYTLGYWGSRAMKLDERTARTVAFEVGMQNGGMATGLAMNVLKSSSAALAPAIFGPWMNVSGSVLANWWQKKPVD